MRNVRSCPRVAKTEKRRFVAADKTPPKKRVFITPIRSATTPPTKAPASVITTPNTLLTAATSSFENPMSL